MSERRVRNVVAIIDFIVGFVLLLGGLNLAIHGDFPNPGMSEVAGVCSAFLGLVMFLSASRLVRLGTPRFRFPTYVLAIIGVSALLLPDSFKNLPISRQAISAWIIAIVVLLACSLLPRALKLSGMKNEEKVETS